MEETRIDSKQKEAVFREFWKNIFNISPEENRTFDTQHEAQVNDYLSVNKHRLIPYNEANINRLQDDSTPTRPISVEEIKAIISKFKDKAPGERGIRKTIMQKLPEPAIAKLKEIFNWSLSMGYFPDKFKNAVMILIPKEGKDPRKPENYRPISLLEIPGKVFEKIINNRITNYIERCNLFNNNQYGFRKGRGTQQAIAAIYETIAMSQRNRQQCNIVCRDVAKAFDKMWKPGLQYKILQINVPHMEKILCNFVEGRTAMIRLDTVAGPRFPLQSGVPQGSTLSPTLFILYTADLERPNNNCVDVSFADDITQIMLYPLKSKEMLTAVTVNEIKRINDFEKRWKIKTNKNKFQLLSVSATKPKEVTVDQERIPFCNKVKILGMEFGTRGVSTHMKRRLAMAKKQFTKLKRFKGMSTNTQLHFYKTLIRPIMEYPAIPLCISSKTNIRKMQQFQNRALRAATNRNEEDTRLTISELHDKYRIEPINTRLYTLSKKVWDKMAITNEELARTSEEQQTENPHGRDHSWWRRIAPYLENGPPDPDYAAAL